MRKYTAPVMKGKKEKEKPTKINEKGQIDYSDNFAIKLHSNNKD